MGWGDWAKGLGTGGIYTVANSAINSLDPTINQNPTGGTAPPTSGATGPSTEGAYGAGHFGSGPSGPAGAPPGVASPSDNSFYSRPTDTSGFTTPGLGSTARGYLGDAPSATNAAQALGGLGLAAGSGTAAATAQTGPLSQPGYSENFYSRHGNDLMNPSNSEQLYAEGDAGSNSYYDYAQQQATNSIDAAERVRGGDNSGAALAEIGNSTANLRGQQALGLTQLAGQADTAKEGRYGLTGQMADTAQSHEEARINGGVSGQAGISGAQAGQVNQFYSQADKDYQSGNMAAVELDLKAAGMSEAEIQQWMQIGGAVGSTVVKAAA